MALTLTDPQMEGIQNTALQNLGAAHWSMQRLRQLDSYVPDIEAVATKSIVASPGLYKASKKQELSNSDKNALVDAGVTVGRRR